MKKIVIGERLKDKKYDYRETCFGICVKDGKALLVKKDGLNACCIANGGLGRMVGADIMPEVMNLMGRLHLVGA